MFIDVEGLRKVLLDILKEKKQYNIVCEIKANGGKMHSASLTNFLNEREVTVTTLQELDIYVTSHILSKMPSFQENIANLA